MNFNEPIRMIFFQRTERYRITWLKSSTISVIWRSMQTEPWTMSCWEKSKLWRLITLLFQAMWAKYEVNQWKTTLLQVQRSTIHNAVKCNRTTNVLCLFFSIRELVVTVTISISVIRVIRNWYIYNSKYIYSFLWIFRHVVHNCT